MATGVMVDMVVMVDMEAISAGARDSYIFLSVY